MEQYLIKKLSEITEEEKLLLQGNQSINQRPHILNNSFLISDQQLLKNNQTIAISTHRRFADFPLHTHNYVEMMIVCLGEITHEIEGKTVNLKKGDLLVMNRHISHSIKKAEKNDVGVNFIISNQFLSGLLEDVSDNLIIKHFIEENIREKGLGQFLVFKTAGLKPIENLIENLIYMLINNEINTNIMQKTVALLFNQLSIYPQTLVNSPLSKTENQKQTIIRYIKSNYRNASLNELASKMYLTMPYLSRLIKELFKKSFLDLLQDYRFELAKKFLQDTDLSVGQIINKVGYENYSYFHKQFKNRFGLSPHQWRKTRQAYLQ
ncbi:MAG TPA: AraC family transcriptional regulator [Clostridia bacterium]